jgi:NtrC-family two-component system response regulator AlgB
MQGARSAPLQLGARVSLAELEAEHIKLIVAASKSQEEAAQVLGIDPTTLYRKRRRQEMTEEMSNGRKTA